MSSLDEAVNRTPDPARALKNLKTFLSEHAAMERAVSEHIGEVANLFAYAQFLANFSVRRPEALFRAIGRLHQVQDRDQMRAELEAALKGASLQGAMSAFREFKKEKLIEITLRDAMGISSPTESMEQLSDLADSIIEAALGVVAGMLRERYGEPHEDSFSVLALGKLGARELNYSSDVDLIFVYGTEKGQTTGVPGPTGATINAIGNHEFYCRLASELSRFLSQMTEDGVVYRVDLRLRPDGQRGEATLPLRSYELYYESWGREWERLALIRARHVAGDKVLGEEFMKTIKPFVWRKYLDFSTIDEIRGLKSRIDATFKKDDIKRGHGGIREIEFFAQAFQLVYGGKEPLLRNRSTLITLYMLWQKNFIGDDDHKKLSESYIYLRRIEHYIQMLNDVQTHVLPADADQREALARKMGHTSYPEFQEELQSIRHMVRGVYDLFFRKGQEEHGRAHIFLSEDFDEDEIGEYLTARGFPDETEGIRLVSQLRQSIGFFHSLKGRRLLEKVMPDLAEAALASSAPERVLRSLVHFLEMVSNAESYLELLEQNRKLAHSLIEVFSKSDYLSRLILSNVGYLDMLTGGMPKKKTLSRMKQELKGMSTTQMPISAALRIFKRSEEIRLGLMFLNRRIDVKHLLRGLSKVAETVVGTALEAVALEMGPPPVSEVSIIAMGKFGGRELTVGSDLDILFSVSGEADDFHVRVAERFLRVLQLYTNHGIAYKVDTRLRPEGTKGPLINSVAGYREYYLRSADNWEIQALLKARPVTGGQKAARVFMTMRDEVFRERAQGVKATDIMSMRAKIISQLAKADGSIDIKLHKGGIEEIEFIAQYLQLRHPEKLRVFRQDTPGALHSLWEAGAVPDEDLKYLSESYIFYRTIESYMRLSVMSSIRASGHEARHLAAFLQLRDADELIEGLARRMEKVSEIAGRLYHRH